MSDPKPLRFARVDDHEPAPSWLPGEAGDKQLTSMRPPRVEIPTIDGAAYRPGLDHLPPGVAGGSAANLNGADGADAAEPAVPMAEFEALRQELETARQENAALRGQVEQSSAVVAQAQEHFARAAADLASARMEALSQVEADLLSLAVGIAGTILEGEVDENPELHERLVVTGMEYLEGESRVTLRCAPDAYDPIVQCFGGESFEVNGSQVRVTVDGSLVGLGCVLETPERRVDARLSERLAAVRVAMLAEQRKRQERGAG